METLIPSVGPLSRSEPIPGYVLKARLGSGGYGEVWEAEAPGGLRKALKFVYGRLDESRSERTQVAQSDQGNRPSVFAVD